MAKKKHRKKRHRFKYAQTTPQATTSSGAEKTSPDIKAEALSESARVGSEGISYAGFDYVLRDIRKIIVLAVIFVAGQLLLWYVFNNTGLGDKVYNLIRL